MCPYFAYARLAGIIVGGIALGFAWMTVQHWRDDSRALATVKAEAAREVAQARQAVAALERAQRAAKAATEGYQRELETLRNRPDRVRTVRVCNRPRLPADAPAAGRTDGPGQTRELVPDPMGSAGREVDVTDLLIEADRCSAQLRSLQGWVQATR